jgi:uncharacterized protein (TIGR04255 family)
MNVNVGGDEISGAINLNYEARIGETHIVLTRVASPEFAAGSFPHDSSAIIDIDVSTHSSVSLSTSDEVLDWVTDAHRHEKKAFFMLIPPDKLDELVEEWEEA